MVAFSPRNYLTLKEVFTVFFCLQTKTMQISRPPHMLVLMPDCPSAPLPLTCSCSGFKTQLVAQPREGTHYTCTAGNFETSQRLHLTCEAPGSGRAVTHTRSLCQDQTPASWLPVQRCPPAHPGCLPTHPFCLRHGHHVFPQFQTRKAKRPLSSGKSLCPPVTKAGSGTGPGLHQAIHSSIASGLKPDLLPLTPQIGADSLQGPTS